MNTKNIRIKIKCQDKESKVIVVRISKKVTLIRNKNNTQFPSEKKINT